MNTTFHQRSLRLFALCARTGLPVGWTVAALVLWAASLGLRVAAMIWLPLAPEEAYYWMYSQHAALSYFDHPPMVAWLIGLGTWLFGHNEFGVRAMGGLLMLLASGLMYLFGRMWFGWRAGLAAGVLLQVLPMYFGVGLIATMDSALLFFWLLCLWGVSVALRKQRPWGWYVAGVGLGGAMLSKYTGVFLGVGALLVMLAHRPWRQQLRTVHPYASALLALVLFSPVVIWNAQHEWASFRFQSVERFAGHAFNPHGVVEFVGLQLLVATPLVLAGLVWIGWRLTRGKRAVRWWIALCFSLPLLALMSYKSFYYRIHLNWTLPVYVSVFPGLTWLALAQWRRARRTGHGLVLGRVAMGTMVGCMGLTLLAMAYLLALQPRMGWISAFGPWRELAAIVEKDEDLLDRESGIEPLIIANGKYRLASVLAFYRTPLENHVRASQFTTSQWIVSGPGLGFAYWTERTNWIGRDCIVVDDDGDIEKFAPYFETFEVLDDPRLTGTKYRIAIGRRLRE